MKSVCFRPLAFIFPRSSICLGFRPGLPQIRSLLSTAELLPSYFLLSTSTSDHNQHPTPVCLSILPPETGKSPLKKAEVLCTVPCRSLLSPSYYHSFGMTDNYFIFIEQPFKLDILKMATAYMRGVNWASCLKHCPEENVISENH